VHFLFQSGKGCRPSCEVKLFRQLSSLLRDLDCLEIKILTNTRSAREKLYKEWVEFNNRYRCSVYCPYVGTATTGSADEIVGSHSKVTP
jgi:hypothetical protein